MLQEQNFNIKPSDTFDRKIEAILGNTVWVYETIMFSDNEKFAEVYFLPRTPYRNDEIVMVVLSDVSDQMLVSYYVPDSSVTQRDKSQRSELLRFKCSINDAFQAGRIVNGYTLLVRDKLQPFQKFEYEMEI